jgi:hypothetical protein
VFLNTAWAFYDRLQKLHFTCACPQGHKGSQRPAKAHRGNRAPQRPSRDPTEAQQRPTVAHRVPAEAPGMQFICFYVFSRVCDLYMFSRAEVTFYMFLCVFEVSCRLPEVQVCSLYVFLRVSGVSVCSLHVFLRVFRPPEATQSPPEAQQKPNGGPERSTERPRGLPEAPQSSPDSPQRPPEAQQRPTDAQQRPEEAHSGPHSPSKAARGRNLYGFSRVFTCIFEVPLGAARAQFIRVLRVF